LICEIAGVKKELFDRDIIEQLNVPQILVIEGAFPFITIPDYDPD